MRFEELATRAGTTAADIGNRADRPSFAGIVARRHRRMLVVGWSTATAVAIVVIGTVWLWPASAPEAPPAAADTTSTTLATTTTRVGETTLAVSGSSRETCPITFPEDTPFIPPVDVSLLSAGDVWYGTPELWTFVHEQGQVWDGLPVGTDGSLTQKTFWWSIDYVSTIEIPGIDVTAKYLDAGSTIEASGANGGGNAEQGIFMVAGLQFPQAGCWRVTAEFGDATLSYVAWAEGR